eukprot:m.36752 g.36752  ORF g.36752 m.36752 type:complete len:144 (+) comp11459_c0_seq1:293-724(+)
MASEWSADNIFQKIIEGKIPSYKIFETEHVLAILDAFPVAKGHSLLLPKAKGHVTLDTMDADTSAALFRELPRLIRAVKAATGCDAVNVISNNGPASGQAVFHVHIHVVPRYDADELFQLPKSGPMISADEGKALLQAMAPAL